MLQNRQSRWITPTSLIRGPDRPLSVGAHTITGLRHVVNQDRYLADTASGIFIVADGMGGMRAGERASQMAVDLLSRHPRIVDREKLTDAELTVAISEAFRDVSETIVETGASDPQLDGMGTTAVMAVVEQSRMFIAGLGDSRAYLLREGVLHQYTVDHSMAQLLVSEGRITPSEARRHRWRHMLWQFLGYPLLKNGPQVSTIDLEPGDRLLLSTDGVTSVLTEAQLVASLCKKQTAAEAAGDLVESAVRYGSRDDATCVVIFVDDPDI
jgi:protein phosphatase